VQSKPHRKEPTVYPIASTVIVMDILAERQASAARYRRAFPRVRR
jgi:hypothetical protein